MTTYLSCAMCGLSGPQVRARMIEWAEPIGAMRFEVLPCCVDIAECIERVRQQGDVWPLVETSNDRGVA